MPKNKAQGIIFGLIMSYSMAIGMEIYNNAIQQGVHLQPGGFTNLTYAVVGKALVEAAFMGGAGHGHLQSVGQPAGGKAGCEGLRSGQGQPLLLPADAAGGDGDGHVPVHVSGGHHHLYRHHGRRTADAAAGEMVRHAAEEPAHGVFLEYVRGGAVHQLGVRKAVPMKKAACPADRLLFYAQVRGEGTNRRFRSAWVGMPSSTALSLYCHMSKA